MKHVMLNASSKTAPRDKAQKREATFFTTRVNPSKRGLWLFDEGKRSYFLYYKGESTKHGFSSNSLDEGGFFWRA